jgi:hypothetical protein
MTNVGDGGDPFEFSREYIKERFLEHWTLAEQFGCVFLESNGVPPDLFEVDTRRLKFAVESAYQDIARYKDYHQEDPANSLLDCTKRCAYLVKWIVRFKPIVVKNVQFENEDLDYVELINEAFVMFLFDLHLSDEVQRDVGLTEPKIQHFAYDLLYRQISVDGWIAIFQLLKDCCYPEALEGTVPFIEAMPAS